MQLCIFMFQVGLEKMVTEHTRLTYMTTGVLLQKLVSSKCLTEYSHIFVDEVHNVDTDYFKEHGHLSDLKMTLFVFSVNGKNSPCSLAITLSKHTGRFYTFIGAVSVQVTSFLSLLSN